VLLSGFKKYMMVNTRFFSFREVLFFSSLIALSFLVSCGTTKTVKLISQAEVLVDSGYKQRAISIYDLLIADTEGKGKPVPDSVYARAGMLALEFNDNHKAIGYLEKATSTAGADCSSLFLLSKAYRAIDNLSKEISALEQVIDNCSGFDSLFSVQTRLMHTYILSQNYDKALALWTKIPDGKESSEPLLTDYLTVLMEGDNDVEAMEIVKKLLKVNPKNTAGLFYLGSFYYLKAENKYRAEMDSYNANKTQRRYLYLVEQLKMITKDYQAAKFYFETLYKFEPNNRNAEYLANIFARLNNESKSQYYRSLIK
jgi:tetratricopeptide (TPR) repeat protein